MVPAQPRALSIRLQASSSSQPSFFIPVAPPRAISTKPIVPNKSLRPRGACQVLQCGGQCKRYIQYLLKTKLLEAARRFLHTAPPLESPPFLVLRALSTMTLNISNVWLTGHWKRGKTLTSNSACYCSLSYSHAWTLLTTKQIQFYFLLLKYYYNYIFVSTLLQGV